MKVDYCTHCQRGRLSIHYHFLGRDWSRVGLPALPTTVVYSDAQEHEVIITHVSRSDPKMSDILSCIDGIFEKEEIKEVGITMDSSLPSVISVEGNLGISLTAIKPLMRYVLTEFKDTVKNIRSDPENLHKLSSKLRSLTRAMLLIKGDIPMALNYRKRLMEVNEVSSAKEVELSTILLNKHPKHSNLWQHRRWCHAQCFRTCPCKILDIENEAALCTKIAQNTPKNYHTWVHRLWILQFMSPQQV